MTNDEPTSPEDYARRGGAALVGYLIKMGFTLEDARDAASETVARMCADWNGIAHPRSWARVTAYRVAVDAQRARRSEGEKGRRAETQAGPADPAAEDLWMLKEEQRAVIDCIRGLPPRQRSVIALHLDGFANTEIAEIIDVDVQTVGSNLRHAKKRLRQNLESRGVYRHGRVTFGADGGERSA